MALSSSGICEIGRAIYSSLTGYYHCNRRITQHNNNARRLRRSLAARRCGYSMLGGPLTKSLTRSEWKEHSCYDQRRGWLISQLVGVCHTESLHDTLDPND